MPDATAKRAERAERIEARVHGTRFGPIRWFDEIDSTNRYLLDLAARGSSAAVDGIVAVADVQTAGRGRLGRGWLAPPGTSLLVSVLLRAVPSRAALPRERLPLATTAAALAACDAVHECTGLDVRVKWPNDLVVDDRKLAGLLAESLPDGTVVVGMGLNVRWDELPGEIAATATALNLCGADVEREDLLVAWLRAFERHLGALDEVVAAARSRSATLGRRVRVDLPDGVVEGTAEDLDDDGHLVVRRADGRVATIAAGDVVHVRPARA